MIFDSNNAVNFNSLVFSVIGGFVGAFTVHLLSRLRSREEWIRDRQIQEWRELMDAMGKAEEAAIHEMLPRSPITQRIQKVLSRC
jgi:hypothetical protein